MVLIQQLITNPYLIILGISLPIYIACVPILRNVSKKINEKKEKALQHIKNHGKNKKISAIDVIHIYDELKNAQTYYGNKENESKNIYIALIGVIGSSLLGLISSFMRVFGAQEAILSLSTIGIMIFGILFFIYAPKLFWWWINNS